jgi:hypothetical protein
MASVAELEAGLISQRTKAALAAAKARGTVLGGSRGEPKVDVGLGTAALQQKANSFAGGVGPIVVELRAQRQIAAELWRVASGRRAAVRGRRRRGQCWGAISRRLHREVRHGLTQPHVRLVVII